MLQPVLFIFIIIKRASSSEKAHLSDPASVNDHPITEHGKAAWKILVDKEKWDMALYYYGLELFAEQRNRYPPKIKLNKMLQRLLWPS